MDSTVSQLYKARWSVEVFFKHLNQLFRVKTFVGTSANAVRIQMWCAMVAILLLKHMKSGAKYKWHLSNLISFLRLNLFTKINLWIWLHKPFGTRSNSPQEKTLSFSYLQNKRLELQNRAFQGPRSSDLGYLYMDSKTFWTDGEAIHNLKGYYCPV